MLKKYYHYIDILMPIGMLLVILGLVLEPYSDTSRVELMRGLLIGLAVVLNVVYIAVQADFNTRDRT
jgi:hypothetical protein